MSLNLKIKHVELRDFSLNKDVSQFKPHKDIEIKWQQADNNRAYASFIGSKSDINAQLSQLNNRILTERVRTLKEIPKIRRITTQHHRKMEMRTETKEIY